MSPAAPGPPRPEVVSAADDALIVAAGPLRLSFRWDSDRWVHALELDGRPVAASVEWDPALGDPARAVSPAYQQLTRQDGPDGLDILLVGQWGRHHFSGVFRVGPTPDGVAIAADVAVRSRADLDALAATYAVALTSGDLDRASPDGVAWTVGRGRLALEPVAAGGAVDPPRVVLAESGRGATRVQVDAPVRPGEATRRLAYRWAWTSAVGAPARGV